MFRVCIFLCFFTTFPVVTIAQYPTASCNSYSSDYSYIWTQTTCYTNATARFGAYWPLGSTYAAYQVVGATTQAPSAVPYDDTSIIPLQNSSNPLGTTAPVLQLVGGERSCLKAQFTSAEDKCINDPSSCTLANAANMTGLSMSIFVKLAPTLTDTPRYIVDTGGNEQGGPGVAIYYVDSTKGDSFDQVFTILVSTGANYWKVIITGMLQYNTWQNLAFRWSPLTDHGLQVFVNRVSVGWKRLGAASVGTTRSAFTNMTIGCKLDGKGSTFGFLENLAVWYWRLSDVSNDWFDGSISSTTMTLDKYSQGTVQPVPTGYSDTGDTDDEQDSDTADAIDGDCSQMSCADTVHEIQTSHMANPAYSGTELVNAMIRTVNKAGKDGLSATELAAFDIDVWSNYLVRVKLATLGSPINSDTAKTYGRLVGVLAKFTEENIYGDYWLDDAKKGNLGITNWMYKLEDLLKTLTSKMAAPSVQIRETNDTIVTFGSVMRSDSDNLNVFVNYAAKGDPGYTFKTDKGLMDYWKGFKDYFAIPSTLLDGYSANSALQIITKAYNQLYQHIPANLDSRITGPGIETATFTVNSRVMSLTVVANGSNPNATYLAANPIQFTVKHQKQQPDAAFMKGAILCAYWIYNSNNAAIGAWDIAGCSVKDTNDTHTTCSCGHMTDYAILMEEVDATDGVPKAAYAVIYLLLVISLICLIIFIAVILHRKELHYELHIVTINFALAMLLSIIFYISTAGAYKQRLACLAVSVFIHYFYTAAYTWYVCLTHYVFRAITSGKLGNVLAYYCAAGWGLPAVVVAVLVGLDVTRYGVGDRCFGTTYNSFMTMYIGTFIFFLVAIVPMLAIAVCNLNSGNVKDPEDWKDIKLAFFGILGMYPLIAITWFLAIPVYIVPQISQAYDFCFEFFNAWQGIVFFILLGVMIPSFRNGLMCKKQLDDDTPCVGTEDDTTPGDGEEKPKKNLVTYFS